MAGSGNPLIAQGTLNRVRGSVVWANFPSLNVTAPYLSKEGIRLALQGESTLYLPTMTGAVTSPEPYMMIECTIHLLKTQGLAQLYKNQMELQSTLGDGSVRPDSTSLGIYQIINCSIKSIRELEFSGESAIFAVNLGGYYLTNSSLFG
jgi:hypothetical protein